MRATAVTSQTAGRGTAGGGIRSASFRGLLRGEWIKLRSLRSTWWILAFAALIMPAFAIARMSSIAQVPEAVGHPSLVGAVYVTSGVAFVQLAFAVLGVISVAGEYGSGQMRTTLTASPRRVRALAAKLVVTVLAAVATSVLGVALAWGASTPWFEETGMTVSLLDPQDARIILGTPLYLGAITALAFGVGAIVRSSAAGISIVVGLLLVLENALGMVPWAPVQAFGAYLPSSAGSRLLQSDDVGSVITASNTALLGHWEGFGVLLLWVAAVLTAAAIVLRRRDA